jgi:hypothetical protein
MHASVLLNLAVSLEGPSATISFIQSCASHTNSAAACRVHHQVMLSL